jgi:hypothetical protein
MKKYLMNMTHSALLIFAAILAAPTFASDDSAISSMDDFAQNIGTLHQEISADKRLLVEHNMNLTDVELKVFWPIYDTYQKELSQIIKRLAKVIDTYALEYNKGALSNETAKKLLDEALAIELAEVKLKQSYISKFGKVLPMTKVARYIQIETKIRAVLYFRLADKIPLVE